eukprot:4203478-Heterocapsa_arctica.AAC.1
MFLVTDIFQSVDVMNVIGIPPGILEFDDFVLVRRLGDGILQRRSMWGDGVLSVIVVLVIVLV